MTRDEIKARLKDYTYSDYLALYEKYRDWLIKEKVEGTVSFPNSRGEIAVFQFRCNENISFNDVESNNDLLVLVEVVDNKKGIKDYFFDVTVDPKTTKHGIAHTCAQIYRGNVGAHRQDPNRPCIRSDYGFGTWITRTDGKGNVIDINSSERFVSAPLHCGINIHNANGAFNSSLGCTIFRSEGAYQKIFRPIIVDCVNRNNIMVALIDEEDFDEVLLGESVEQPKDDTFTLGQDPGNFDAESKDLLLDNSTEQPKDGDNTDTETKPAAPAALDGGPLKAPEV